MRRTEYLGSIVAISLIGSLLGYTCFAADESTAQPTGELTKLALKYRTDKGPTVKLSMGIHYGHSYTDVYELYFAPIRNSVRKYAEIGILKGASLRMFNEYFPQAMIYGVDIENCSAMNTDRIKTFIADQANRQELQRFIDGSATDFDILIDDGGHTMEQQQVSFGYLFKFVKPGGYYVIEDVHTSLDPKYGRKPDESNTTLTMINGFVRTGKFESPYMTEEEKKYLQGNVESCDLFSRDGGEATLCIFKKRAA